MKTHKRTIHAEVGAQFEVKKYLALEYSHGQHKSIAHPAKEIEYIISDGILLTKQECIV